MSWPASLICRKRSSPLVPVLELPVENDQVDVLTANDRKALGCGCGGRHHVAGAFEPDLLEPGDARIVLDEQNQSLALRAHAILQPSLRAWSD